MDIEIEEARTKRVVVIETKVQAAPEVAQIERYAAAYLGARDILDVLRAGSYMSDTMRQYVAWREALVATREQQIATALSDDPVAARDALGNPAAQWGVMSTLGFRLEGPSAVRLYRGQNLDGSHWTQLSFAPGQSPSYDALFYRLAP